MDMQRRVKISCFGRAKLEKRPNADLRPKTAVSRIFVVEPHDVVVPLL